MIVRISGEGQFRLADHLAGKLNELDNACVAAVEAGDERRFRELFDELVALIEREGEPLADDELVESDVIVPPRDITFEEARRDFTGEGIVPE